MDLEESSRIETSRESTKEKDSEWRFAPSALNRSGSCPAWSLWTSPDVEAHEADKRSESDSGEERKRGALYKPLTDSSQDVFLPVLPCSGFRRTHPGEVYRLNVGIP